MQIKRTLPIIASIGLMISSANSEERRIVVSDCESKPRIIEFLGDVDRVGLRASVVDSQSARVVVTLTNLSSGEPLIQATEKGGVEFQDLKPGQYTMCLEPPTAEASDIEIVRPLSAVFETVSF